MITQVPIDLWRGFFDKLSRDLDGWETRVGIYSNDIGAQAASEGLPFHGLTAEETSTGDLAIELSVGDRTAGHQTHTVVNPVTVAFERVGNGCVLDIEDGAGTKMIVEFIQPFPLVVEYESADIVSVASSGG